MPELVLGNPDSGTIGSKLIGEGRRIDCVLTKPQFVDLCYLMMNGNSKTEFMHVYRDDQGNPRFVKSQRTRVERRISWALDTITGQAKRPIGIGFYPWNKDRYSRWGAMDFDAHDGDAQRAQRLATSALSVAIRKPDIYLILTTSGSEGWHLFFYALQYYSIDEWTRFLKSIAAEMGTEIKPGSCEIFPNDTRTIAARPYGIRAPGTWNPKTGQFGRVVFSSVAALLVQIKRRKEESPFLYPSTFSAATHELNDKRSFYTGGTADWQTKFEIRQSGTRHAKLKELVCETFMQAGHDVVRQNAAGQFLRSRAAMNATLDEHLSEFEELWEWKENNWFQELTGCEKRIVETMSALTEKEFYRILVSFARLALNQGLRDFPVSLENVGARLGISFQRVSKLRQKFVAGGLIVPTAPAVPNRSAARYRICDER